MKIVLVVIVTATSTWIFAGWTQPPAPMCCPGGRHVRMEDGTWRHVLKDPVYDSKRGEHRERGE